MKESLPAEPVVGIFTTDSKLIIRVWDEIMVRLTGLAAERARGVSVSELFPEIEARGHLKRFHRVLAEGVVEVLAPAFHHYLLKCAPLQATKYFDHMQQRVTIAPLREGEEITGLIVSVEDVTGRLEQERDLAAQLDSPDETIRLAAAHALATDSVLEPSEHLLNALSDESWRVRRAAAGGLARRAAPAAIAALLEEMRTNHQHLGMLNSALQVLAMSDVDTLSPLIEFLQGNDADLRIQAALALGEQRDQRATPALLDALGDADVNVRYHAIEALGKLRAPEAVAALASVTETRDFFLAYPALDALARIGDESIAPRLVPLLTDEMLREPVAEALGQLGDETVVAPLAALLNSADAPVLAIARALAALYDRFEQSYGEGAYIADLSRERIEATGAQNLLDALTAEPAENLRPLALVLGWLEGAGVERALTRLLGESVTRSEVIEALVRHGQSVTALLIDRLGDEDLETRRAAVIALGRIGDRAGVPALVSALEEDELKLVAAGALAKIGDRSAFEPLLALLGDTDASVRQAAVGALNSLGSPLMAARMVELLDDEDPNVREAAARIAGYFGYQECTELLLEHCRDENERVRRAVVEHLPYLDDERAIEALAHALRHDTPRVRAAAASALSAIESPQALPLLNVACADTDAWVRYFAARALAHHTSVESVEALARLLRTDEAGQVRIAALESLRSIGGERVRGIIAQFVRDENGDVRRVAADFLKATDGDS